jgi:hypothetical protein
MSTAQSQPAVFDVEDAARFAALLAGFDTTNPSESEAMSKARALRRMAAERKVRIVDALELPEIRQALDDQMEPIRQVGPDVDALQAEIEDLRGKLAMVVPKVTELAHALSTERKDLIEIAAAIIGTVFVSGCVAIRFGIVGYILTGTLCLLIQALFWKD